VSPSSGVQGRGSRPAPSRPWPGPALAPPRFRVEGRLHHNVVDVAMLVYTEHALFGVEVCRSPPDSMFRPFPRRCLGVEETAKL
jgi:hypothetical protein